MRCLWDSAGRALDSRRDQGQRASLAVPAPPLSGSLCLSLFLLFFFIHSHQTFPSISGTRKRLRNLNIFGLEILCKCMWIYIYVYYTRMINLHTFQRDSYIFLIAVGTLRVISGRFFFLQKLRYYRSSSIFLKSVFCILYNVL